MLTPAEEMGLKGLSLASRVRKAFYHITERDMLALMERFREEALKRHLVYLREGVPDPIHVMPCPITALPHQMAYVHSVTLTIQNALKRLPELYFQDFAVRDVLRLSAYEENWLLDCWGPGQRENNPVFGRYDAVVDFLSPMWKDSLKFVEPNLSGIGGLHLVPTAERMVSDLVFPLLRAQDAEVQLSLGADVRELLMQEVLDHLQAIGRMPRHLCFVEPKYAGSGPDEQEELAHYYERRFGLKITHADPSELTLEGNEVFYQGDALDLAYRDYSVNDLFELERAGGNVEPMRVLFGQNRMISSIAAELDQKSCWEVLTDNALAQKHFSADERRIFRRHVLWTRVLSERHTSLPDGHVGDLLAYVRDEQDTLVIKPNRDYGGHGVLLGPALSEAEWEAAVLQALAEKGRWVVQQLASIPVSEFPVVGPDGRIHVEPFYTVMGFAPTTYGLAVLGRASQKQVVNVAQRGGMCVVALGQPPGHLHGPQT